MPFRSVTLLENICNGCWMALKICSLSLHPAHSLILNCEWKCHKMASCFDFLLPCDMDPPSRLISQSKLFAITILGCQLDYIWNDLQFRDGRHICRRFFFLGLKWVTLLLVHTIEEDTPLIWVIHCPGPILDMC